MSEQQNVSGEPVLSIEDVAVADLRPHPRNYRKHPDDQLAHICRSIQEHGFYRNVVVARDGVILAGHGVVEAAKKLGIERIPIRRVDVASDDPRAIKIMVGDNEMGRIAEIDDRGLTEMLKELSLVSDDYLLGTGFDRQSLAVLAMVTRPASEIADFDAAAHWAGMPAYDPGVKRVQLNVFFDREEDRAAFLERAGIAREDVHDRQNGWSTWWPKRERSDLSSVKFVEGPAKP